MSLDRMRPEQAAQSIADQLRPETHRYAMIAAVTIEARGDPRGVR
jgi:hypothetical protein